MNPTLDGTGFGAGRATEFERFCRARRTAAAATTTTRAPPIRRPIPIRRRATNNHGRRRLVDPLDRSTPRWNLVCTEGGRAISPNRCHPKAYATGGNKISGLRDCSKPFDDDLSDERIYIIHLLRLLFCLINLSMDKPNISQYINLVAYYVDLYLPRFKIWI